MERLTRITLVLNGDTHALDRSTDTASLKRSVTAAVRAGGGFVEIRTATEQAVSVLITPNTALTVWFETVYVDMHAECSDERYLPERYYFDE